MDMQKTNANQYIEIHLIVVIKVVFVLLFLFFQKMTAKLLHLPILT